MKKKYSTTYQNWEIITLHNHKSRLGLKQYLFDNLDALTAINM